MQHHQLTSSIYYKDLGVYRLLLQQDQTALLQFVKDYLQEILVLDQKSSHDLFQTLAVYLTCNGAKMIQQNNCLLSVKHSINELNG